MNVENVIFLYLDVLLRQVKQKTKLPVTFATKDFATNVGGERHKVKSLCKVVKQMEK